MAYFSVIVPVYKVEPYLAQCVESVLNQSFGDFELLLIDDGSPDKCGELCDAYAAKDPRVRVIHKENGGLSSARNCGMKTAAGAYILFLDSDDYWEDLNALKRIRALVESTDADVVLLKHRKLDMRNGTLESCAQKGNQKDIAEIPYAEQLRFCVAEQMYDTCAWNKIFRRTLAEKCDLSFREGIIAEDLDWAARLMLASEKLAILNAPMYVYRKGRAGAITSSLKLKNLVDTSRSIERCLTYVENMTLDETLREAYFGYVAYRYAIWMAESSAVRDREKKPLIRKMKTYRWLLKYDLNPKVKAVKAAEKLLGYRVCSGLLGIYLKRR